MPEIIQGFLFFLYGVLLNLGLLKLWELPRSLVSPKLAAVLLRLEGSCLLKTTEGYRKLERDCPLKPKPKQQETQHQSSLSLFQVVTVPLGDSSTFTWGSWCLEALGASGLSHAGPSYGLT